MQGKGLIRFFFILLLVVSAIQYLFIIPTNRVEKAAENYAVSTTANMPEGVVRQTAYNDAKSRYLDSMSTETVFNIPGIKKYNYEELKRQQLALGLDLQGGMSTVLQVDLRSFLVNLSNNNQDPTFQQALDNAQQRLTSEQSDYITLFGEEFSKIANGKKLSSIFRNNAALRDDINIETSDSDILRLLRTRANETVDLTYKMLKDRIDKFGVTQPNVSKDESRDLILVELPGISNPERARRYLQATAKLEFWDVYRVTDPGILDAFYAADQRLKKLEEGDTAQVATVQFDTIPYRDTLTGRDTFQLVERNDNQQVTAGPLFTIFQPNVITNESALGSPAVMGITEKNKREQVMNYLTRPDIKGLFPRDLEFKWAQKGIKDPSTGQLTNAYQLYAIKVPRGTGAAPLQGDRVVDAFETQDQQNQIVVSLRMDPRGAKIWGDMTTKAAQDNNREIAIVLDDEVVSAPRVNTPITDGNSQIEGGFSLQEAKDLANILQVGKLPTETRIIQENLVGPSLGHDNIAKSLRSMIIGLTIVLIFMIIYYGGAGIVSIIALLLNLFFIFGALASLGTVLTLPGIAGIVLTIGMAVDANVIIYERIREELRAGKSLTNSIMDGFKHSYSAIIDANVTGFLTAIVLAYFGLGPIKGFAVVLMIGILSSLFTAVLVSRMIIDWWTKKGRGMTFSIKATENVLSKVNIDWLTKRRVAYVISGTLILISIASMVFRGFDLGVDFKGGYSYNVQFERSVSPQDLRNALTGPFEKTPVVKAVDISNTYNITTDYLVNDQADDAADRVMDKLYEGVNTLMGGNLDAENFKSPEGTGTHVASSSKVGPTIADDIKSSSVYATLFSLLLIFLYIFIRFSRWQFSMGAVIALFHDTLITLGIFSLFKGIVPWSLEIDQAFIAAILTVIGYSINDTVIVFDRIREYLNEYTKKDKFAVINDAINSTLSRTLITSLTTLFVVLVLFLFGGSSIKGFAFAILVGIGVGTYSSIFIATPIMVDMTKELTATRSSTSKKHFSKAAGIK
ncbi:MAG: protein translocase subunit SecDF [Saprospiraceae bacterium]|nr:protein translocase subunit SecDF [Saprospiraceae bacterium]